MKCSICLIQAEPTDEMAATRCGHCFHKSCIEAWIRSSNNCPTCREHASLASIQKLFIDFDSENDESESSEVKTTLELQMQLNIAKTNLEASEREREKLESKVRKLERELECQKRGGVSRRSHRSSALASLALTAAAPCSSINPLLNSYPTNNHWQPPSWTTSSQVNLNVHPFDVVSSSRLLNSAPVSSASSTLTNHNYGTYYSQTPSMMIHHHPWYMPTSSNSTNEARNMFDPPNAHQNLPPLRPLPNYYSSSSHDFGQGA